MESFGIPISNEKLTPQYLTKISVFYQIHEKGKMIYVNNKLATHIVLIKRKKNVYCTSLCNSQIWVVVF